MIKQRKKRITKEEQSDLAEVLYYISPEEEREAVESFSSSRELDWEEDRFEKYN